MILEFTVRNFRSIQSEQVFSMVPTKRIDPESSQILSNGPYQALPSAVVFGRNAAGKSNLFKAFQSLQNMVLSVLFQSSKNDLQYSPFKLDGESSSKPTYFKIEFIAKDNLKYMYEVEFIREEIITENLYFFPKGQKAKLYQRSQGNSISFGEYFNGPKKNLESLLYKTQLLLSKVESDNIELLQEPYNFFRKYLFLREPNKTGDDDYISHFSKMMLRKNYPNYAENINTLLRSADTGINNVISRKFSVSDIKLPKDLSDQDKKALIDSIGYRMITTHDCFGSESKICHFDISDESMGTMKLLEVGGLILEALYDGQVLLIDEFDHSLHPKLARSLIKIFQNPKNNPNNAQLIIITHDISLLDFGGFNYDQIWIAEKEHTGDTKYYALSDITGLRKNIPLQKWYMDGRLGGIPVINDSELIFNFGNYSNAKI
jgi:AAA15 family ATPase/GTPase